MMANGGGTSGRMDGRTEVWKLPPVSYRTLALWGRCPKRIKGFLGRGPKGPMSCRKQGRTVTYVCLSICPPLKIKGPNLIRWPNFLPVGSIFSLLAHIPVCWPNSLPFGLNLGFKAHIPACQTKSQSNS